MFGRCQAVAPKNRFKLNAKIYLLDATLISLSLKVFPWATYQKTKGAIKLHMGLSADGYLPEFFDVSKGKEHEINWAKLLKLPAGSFVVFDRGYTDYGWYQTLMTSGVFFVARLKDNALIDYFRKRPGRKAKGVLLDQEIALKGVKGKLRLVHFVAEDGNEYRFATNAQHLPAATVAELYKERWQIELRAVDTFNEALFQYRQEMESGHPIPAHQKAYDEFLVLKTTPKRGMKVSFNTEAVNKHISRYAGFQALLSSSIKDPIDAMPREFRFKAVFALFAQRYAAPVAHPASYPKGSLVFRRIVSPGGLPHRLFVAAGSCVQRSGGGAAASHHSLPVILRLAKMGMQNTLNVVSYYSIKYP